MKVNEQCKEDYNSLLEIIKEYKELIFPIEEFCLNMSVVNIKSIKSTIVLLNRRINVTFENFKFRQPYDYNFSRYQYLNLLNNYMIEYILDPLLKDSFMHSHYELDLYNKILDCLNTLTFLIENYIDYDE